MTSLELVAFGIGNFGTGSGLLHRRQTLYPTELRAHMTPEVFTYGTQSRIAHSPIIYNNLGTPSHFSFLWSNR